MKNANNFRQIDCMFIKIKFLVVSKPLKNFQLILPLTKVFKIHSEVKKTKTKNFACLKHYKNCE